MGHLWGGSDGNGMAGKYLVGCQRLGCWSCPEEEEREKKERGVGWAAKKEMKLGLAKENWAARRRKRLVACVRKTMGREKVQAEFQRNSFVFLIWGF
jgi:3'-phosphoadenosine 5'-phosphosulfate sulfotransferase (PAPS reductase)/FAD synthetase